jgi:phytoene dehydrogenase-like protein
MTRKLEELFDLPPTTEEVDTALPELPTQRETILALDEVIDKINDALPAVKGLDASDSEMDSLSDLAKDSYKDLMDLGMQVDSRFAAEIFSVASNMLGHAITAKTAKLDKKLKMVDLQLKKMRLDQQQAIIDAKVADTPDAEAQLGTGHILSRNELLERILASTKQNSQKE